ncbi:MAG: hypothetical protein HYV03_05955 [Deltaproteobacteria bacterium]|nr:hypothetical protein [Deltaproteobacteria bacterium]
MILNGVCITVGGMMGSDTDGDGISDTEETSVTLTDPQKKDTDGDGLVDGCTKDPSTGEFVMDSGELCNQAVTGIFYPDYATLNSADCGGVPYVGCDTNPGKAGDTAGNQLAQDTDSDGLTDRQEKKTYHSNPIKPDTDGDCLKDGVEDTRFDANGNVTQPPDGFFTACMPVGQGLVCTETNANDPDTDKDGLFDGAVGTSNGEDLNCNGFPDKGLIPETNPRVWDTDGDQIADFEEMMAYGGFLPEINAIRATTPYASGCSLAGTAQATPMAKLIWVLLVAGPLVGLFRQRRVNGEEGTEVTSIS